MGLRLTAIPPNQLEVIKAEGMIQFLTPDVAARLSGWVIRHKETGELLTLKVPQRFRTGFHEIEQFSPWQLKTRKAAREAIANGLMPGSFWMAV